MVLERDRLVEKVEMALKEGLAHPNQPHLVAIEGELDVHELAAFVVDYVRQPPPASADRQQVIAQRLKELDGWR